MPQIATRILAFVLHQNKLILSLCARLQNVMGSEKPIPKVGPRSLAGRTVFVAGANGRLGSMIVRLLLRKGCRVRAGAPHSLISKLPGQKNLMYMLLLEFFMFRNRIYASWKRGVHHEIVFVGACFVSLFTSHSACAEECTHAVMFVHTQTRISYAYDQTKSQIRERS